MYQRRTLKDLTKTAFVLLLGILMAGVPMTAFAKMTFNTPAGRGLPGRREGAGTRDACVISDPKGRKNPNGTALSVLALTPGTNEGYTLSEYPTFFFYVPRTTARSLEFSLTDEDDRKVYETTFSTTGEAGIIRIDLPQNASVSPLKLDKPYRWKFSLVCVAGDPTANISRYGWIQRVKADAKTLEQLQRSNPRDLPAIYAEAGIWFDALTELHRLRLAQPKDAGLLDDWINLLKGVDLEMVAQDPLI